MFGPRFSSFAPPHWVTLALAVVAGIALWAAFPDVGAWPLTILALLIVQAGLARDSAGWNFLVGYVFGAVFWLPHVNWVIQSTEVVPWLVLALVLCAPFFGAFGALWTWARRLLFVSRYSRLFRSRNGESARPSSGIAGRQGRGARCPSGAVEPVAATELVRLRSWLGARPWLYALIFAFVWTGVEEWRSRIPFGGFPWGRLAWAAAAAPTGRAAWLGGSVLVTFLLALAAGLIGAALGLTRAIAPQPAIDLAETNEPPATVILQDPEAQPATVILRDQEAQPPTVILREPKQQPPLVILRRRSRSDRYRRIGSPAGDSSTTKPLRLSLALVAAALACVFAPLALPLPHSSGLPAVADPPATAPIEVGDRRVVVDAGTLTAQAGTLTIGFAQGNVDNPGGDAQYNAQAVLENHLYQTALLAQDNLVRTGGVARGLDTFAYQRTLDRRGYDAPLDLIVWPEDSTGWNPATEPVVASMLTRAADAAHTPLLIGAQEWPATGGRYNVMLLWDPAAGESTPEVPGVDLGLSPGEATTGGVISRYAKQRPVPFGEYVPLRSILRHLSPQVDRVTVDMIAAKNEPIIELPVPRLDRTVPLGVGICFEVAYDEVFRQAVRAGAELILVPTNNASFGPTAQSTQQLAMTRLQAITTGRAAAQISTVGVSGVFAPDGTLVARTGLFVPDRFTAELPLRTSITPAVRLGAVPGVVVQTLALALAAAGLIAGRRIGYGDAL